MAYGNEDDFNRKLKEDETPFQSYTITLSERDLTALSNLKDRNGAGMTVGCPTENIAIWKIIDQICETNTHEKEWTCRFCGKSTFETDYDYLVDPQTHLGCALKEENEK